MQVRSGSSTIQTWKKKKTPTSSSRFLWNSRPGWPLFQQAAGIPTRFKQTLWNAFWNCDFGSHFVNLQPHRTDLYSKAMPSSHCYVSWEIHTSAEGSSSEHKLVTSIGREGWHHSLLWEAIFRSYFLLLLVLIGQKKYYSWKINKSLSLEDTRTE